MQRKTFGVRFGAAVFFFTALAACAVPDPVQSDTELVDVEHMDRRPFVITMTPPDWPDDAMLQTEAGLAQAAPLIETTRDQVLAAVFGPHGVTHVRSENSAYPVLVSTFTVTPGFVMHLTDAEAQQIAAHPWVSDVQADEVSRPSR